MSMLNQMLRDLEHRKDAGLLASDTGMVGVSATEVQWEERFASVKPILSYFLAMILMAVFGYVAVQLSGSEFSISGKSNQQNDQLKNSGEILKSDKSAGSYSPSMQSQKVPVKPIVSLKLSDQISVTVEQDEIFQKKPDLVTIAKTPLPVAEKIDLAEEKNRLVEDIKPKEVIFKKVNVQLTEDQKVDQLYDKSLRLIEAGQHFEAQRQLNKALLIKSNSLPVRVLLIQDYLNEGQVSKAENLINKGLQLHPANPELILEKSKLLLQQGNELSALTFLQQVNEPIETATNFYAYKATLLRRTGQAEKAILLYKNLLQIKPGQAQWWAGLAITLESIEQNKDALSAYENAHRLGSLEEPLKTYVNSRVATLTESLLP